MEARAAIVTPFYLTDPIAYPTHMWIDGRGHEQTWADMLRLQQDGTHPAEFAAVRVPVLMLHGRDDPHAGSVTRDDLAAVIAAARVRRAGAVRPLSMAGAGGARTVLRSAPRLAAQDCARLKSARSTGRAGACGRAG